jgi:uncharacterized protein
MSNVVLSLDGRKEVHDRLRRDRAGRGSYDTVVPKFQRLVEKRGGKNYYMRGTFTHDNTDFTDDVLHMADLGFRELSMEPVVCAPSEPWALTEEDLPVLSGNMSASARRCSAGGGREPALPSTLHARLYGRALYPQAPCRLRRAGAEYLAVTPRGELYPCHQFVGEPRFCMGNVWQGVTDKALPGGVRGLYSRRPA